MLKYLFKYFIYSFLIKTDNIFEQHCLNRKKTKNILISGDREIIFKIPLLYHGDFSPWSKWEFIFS